MPTDASHVAQADHNRQFVVDLRGQQTQYKDWIVTVAFYVAVHRIEAYLARTLDIHSTEHAKRDNAMTKIAELRPIYGHYQEMYNKSMESRYECLLAKWTDTEVERILAKLNAIESYLGKLS